MDNREVTTMIKYRIVGNSGDLFEEAGCNSLPETYQRFNELISDLRKADPNLVNEEFTLWIEVANTTGSTTRGRSR